MTRPVRPVALVILTACMIYPGVTLLYQGLYPFFTGETFTLVGQPGAWSTLALKLGIPIPVVMGLKSLLGVAWLAGVLGLWAGDWRAYGLTLAAAAGTLLYPGGSMLMAVIALVCLVFYREDAESVPA